MSGAAKKRGNRPGGGGGNQSRSDRSSLGIPGQFDGPAPRGASSAGSVSGAGQLAAEEEVAHSPGVHMRNAHERDLQALLRRAQCLLSPVLRRHPYRAMDQL